MKIPLPPCTATIISPLTPERKPPQSPDTLLKPTSILAAHLSLFLNLFFFFVFVAHLFLIRPYVPQTQMQLNYLVQTSGVPRDTTSSPA